MRSIVLATHNEGKLREIRQVLADLPVEILGLDNVPEGTELTEPDEHGSNFAENARHKALSYAQQTGQWCLADDSGLCVDALDGAPGVHSARYAADRCPPRARREQIDRENNRKLLEALQDVPDERRTAYFVCHLALSDGERILIETFDTVEGHITRHPQGENGFGYDPLFVATKMDCTTAELSPEEKNKISHRGKSLRHFAKLLQSFLASQQNLSQ